jgi:hypothetical protein
MSKFDPNKYLTDLRGQQYLEVKWRVVWFRADHPGGNIQTDVISTDPLLVKATVFDADGRQLASGHGGADAGGRKVVWSGREFEKAETAAIGRALAHAGYGTQFTGEIEGDHLADSPVTPPAPPNGKSAPAEHWAKDKPTAAKFWTWATEERGLNGDDVLAALKVKRLSEFTGDKEQAVLQIDTYIMAKTEQPDPKAT